MNSDIQTEKKVRYFKVLSLKECIPLDPSTYYRVVNGMLYFYNTIDKEWEGSGATFRNMLEAVEKGFAREIPLEELVLMEDYRIP